MGKLRTLRFLVGGTVEVVFSSPWQRLCACETPYMRDALGLFEANLRRLQQLEFDTRKDRRTSTLHVLLFIFFI